MIPAGWEERALGEVCDIARGGSPRPIKSFLTDDEKGVNWVKISDASKSGKYINKTEQRIIPEGISKSRMVHKGDFLLSNSMSFGRPYIMNISGCIHDGWLLLKTKEKILNEDYLYHLLGSQFVYKQFKRLARGSIVKNLNIGIVSKVKIPIPPLEQQQHIVSILDRAFESVETARTIAEQNREHATNVFESTLERIFSEGGPDWEERTLEEVCDVITDYIANGSFASLKKHVEYKSEKDFAILLRLKDHSNDFKGNFVYINEDAYNFLKKTVVIPGDIIVSNVGARLGTTFKAPDLGLPMNLGPNSLLVKCSKYQEYLYHWLKSPDGQKKIQSIVSGAGQPKFNKTSFRELMVPIPPLAEQQQIVKQLDALNEQTTALETVYAQKVTALEELTQSLLQDAFSGKLTQEIDA